MKQILKGTRWVAVTGLVVGLSVPTGGGAEYPDQKTRPHSKEAESSAVQSSKDSSPIAIKKEFSPPERQYFPVSPVSKDKQKASTRKEPLYRPPHRGAPGGRVGGGTRGPSTNLPVLLALVPDHVGMSSEAQPSLVWYLSKTTNYPLEFTVIDETGVTPLLEKRFPPPTEVGIHVIDLADYDLRLEKGTTYQWFVSLVSDPEHRSTDVLSGGMIQVSEVPESLEEKVKQADPVDAARLWAQAGFWYDAIGIVSTNIQANPSDPQLHDLRASLLEEVELATPAQVDRQQGL